MAGYSSTPLIKKLGIKEGYRVLLLNEPPELSRELGSLPAGVEKCTAKSSGLNYIHLFTQSKPELEKVLPRLKTQLVANGMIWVSWPKKSSGVASDVTEDVIRNAALSIGLVDIKVCA